ncbi:hypothetical protein [uncultured Tateyamaria sp.]|nr:hypothetical protein [uncultured Tateyamaria sp.]
MAGTLLAVLRLLQCFFCPDVFQFGVVHTLAFDLQEFKNPVEAVTPVALG